MYVKLHKTKRPAVTGLYRVYKIQKFFLTNPLTSGWFLQFLYTS